MSPRKANPSVELAERLRFDTLIAELSAEFLSLPAGEVDRGILEAERRICEELALDTAAFWQWSDEGRGCFILTHYYSSQEGPRLPQQSNAMDLFPWHQRQIREGRIVALASLEELPAEAAVDRENALRVGIRSAVTLPLSVGGQAAFGALGFNSVRVERGWPAELVQRLQLVAQVFANALARKRSELALRDSAERLSLATDAAEVGLWILDSHAGVFWVSEKARAMFGFAADESPTLARFEAAVHPDDWPLVRERIRHATQSGEPINLEYRIRRSDGQLRWIASRGRPALLPAGDHPRLMGAILDVTGRKLAEEAARARRARLEAGADLAGLGYYEVDFVQGAGFTDQRLFDLCGLTPGPHHDLRFLQFWIDHVHPDDRPHILEDRHALHEGRVEEVSVEYRYLHPAHGQKWIHHLARVAERDPAGRALRSFGVMRDITPEREAEAEMRRLRLQLWHADRVAQTGAITASLAHELNQPLTGILSTAQAGLRFVAGGNADPALIQEILNNIVHDTKRAGAVINGLRAMLRQKETQREPVRLAETTQEVLDILHSELVGRQIEVWQSLETELTVWADKAQIQQVILNLAMNALEAMHDQPPAERRLEIRLAKDGGTHALVAVHDSGPGIGDDAVERVFQAFWTTKPQGMGIGLAVSRSIIESHGGRLWFENNREGGATFCFSLPLAARDEQGRTPAEAAG